MAPRTPIGTLLVEAGIISAKTLERTLVVQQGSGKRLGALLRDMGIVTEEEVVEALARQCNVRTIRNFADHHFPKELLDLVPRFLALKKLIFPLKRHQGMLAIATTVDYLANKTSMKIYLALACREDIFAAIRKHYLGGRWAKSGRQKILLIDPSPIITKFLQAPLAKEGYEVFVAHDGIDGLKMAFSCNPDLILCDLMMPRMDSYSFLDALKAHRETAETPVILLSAKASAEEEQRALQAGFADFICKPAMPVRVIARIKKAFRLLENEPQWLSHVENR